MTTIIVGPDEIINFFAEKIVNDKIQGVNTIQEYAQGIETQQLDNSAQLVVMHYNACQGNPTELCEAVAWTCADACVALIAPPKKEEEIKNQVSICITSSEELTPAPFYFLSAKTPMDDLEQAQKLWGEWNESQNIQQLYQEESREAWDSYGDYQDTYDHSTEPNVNGLVICCTSGKGGAGKSSVSQLLAAQVAQSSRKAYEEGKSDKPAKVCIVDMDVYSGQLGFNIGQSMPTVTNLVAQSDPRIMFTNENIQKYAISTSFGVDYYLAPRLPTAAESVTPEFYENLIKGLKRIYDLVVLDSSIRFETDRRISHVAYPIADAIIYVTTMNGPTLLNMGVWSKMVLLEQVEGGYGIEPGKVGIIVNRAHDESGVSKDDIMDIVGNPDVAYIGHLPDIPAAITDRAINSHNPQLLLKVEDFGFGEAVYTIVNRIIGSNIPLSPIIRPGSSSNRNSAPRRREQPSRQQPPSPPAGRKQHQQTTPPPSPVEQPKRKKLFGIF